MRIEARLFSIALALSITGCGGGSSGGVTALPARLPTVGAPDTSAVSRRAAVDSSTQGGPVYRVIFGGFKGANGLHPYASVTEFNGALYGTTLEGGTGGDAGTIFEVSTSGEERVIHSFSGPDGAQPAAGLVALNGALYGTAQAGGTYGYGIVFEVDAAGKERTIYTFKGGTDGAVPQAALIAVNGELYGTTASGGNNAGTIFEVSPSGTERVLHRFLANDREDGIDPIAPLIYVNGELYGTTNLGGLYGEGNVFKASLSGALTVLHNFNYYDSRGPDGVAPAAGLITVNGTLYGTTSGGGTHDLGTVFEISTSGTERVVYSFKGGTDGAYPFAGLLDFNGTLYGTTHSGGFPKEIGVVFELNTAGVERVIHTFQSNNSTDGFFPQAGLIDVNGSLYGTTFDGGVDGGTVYEITP